MERWVYDRPSLREFYSLVLVCAPEFPVEDYLSPEEQLSLDSAFAELDQGLSYLKGFKSDTKRFATIRNQLLAAKSAFQRGDRDRGCEIMEELEPLLFGGSVRR